MLSKNKLKYLRSLSLKKNRDVEHVFVAEGPKIVKDLMGEFRCKILIATFDFLEKNQCMEADEIIEVSQKELQAASTLKSPHDVIAVFGQDHIQRVQESTETRNQQYLSIALDGVQDPGNLGTIIRIADWYGIKHIYCSENCADVFSSKVIQATMGAIARVHLYYVNLVNYISENYKGKSIFGTFLDGDNMYQMDLHNGGIIIMGNEGNGISPEIEKLVTHKLFIPSYPPGQATSESLNVAVATAITCAEFRRQCPF